MNILQVKLQTFGPLYSGLWDCAAKTVRQEGVRRGLYAGTAPALVAYISENRQHTVLILVLELS